MSNPVIRMCKKSGCTSSSYPNWYIPSGSKV